MKNILNKCILLIIVLISLIDSSRIIVNANQEVYYDSTYLNSKITNPKDPCMNKVCTDQFPSQCNVKAGEIFFARNTAVGICCGTCIKHADLDPETVPPQYVHNAK